MADQYDDEEKMTMAQRMAKNVNTTKRDQFLSGFLKKSKPKKEEDDAEDDSYFAALKRRIAGS